MPNPDETYPMPPALEAHYREFLGDIPVLPKRYLPWENAGGPNECKHGYAEGIDCPRCDAENPKP